jgi:hypothetical protein
MIPTHLPIENLAAQALKKPSDFGYWGNDDMFKTWGFTGFDQNRDSNILEKSNFKVISDALMSEHPNDFRIETYSHWLVGSVDRLVCRITNDPGKVNEYNITQAFRSVMEWHSNLEEYGVADDNDYSEKMYDECLYILNNMEDYLLLIINTEEDGWAEKLYYTLVTDLNFEFNPDADQYPNDNKILEAALKSNLCNPERWGEWNEWCDEQGFDRPIFPVKENPNQLKLF